MANIRRRFQVYRRLLWRTARDSLVRKIQRHRPKLAETSELPEHAQHMRTLIIKYLSREGTHSSAVRMLANALARQPRKTWVYEGTRDILLITGDELIDLFLAHEIEKIEFLREQINKTLADPVQFEEMTTREKIRDRRRRNKAGDKIQQRLDKEKKILRDVLTEFLIRYPIKEPEKED
jgi:hypothetical protein